MRKTLVISFAAAVLIAAGLIYYFTHAFELTGEQGIGAQASALPQLLQNLSFADPKTEPFAVIEHADVNPYGINTFLHQEVEIIKREEQLRLISEAGFVWIRQEFPWQDIEIHERGDFVDRRNDPNGVDAWAKYDNIVDLAERYDVQIIARISSPPAWSRALSEDQTGTFAPPDDYTDFANFAAALAKRYEGRVTYFQIWNEPNIPPEWGNYPVNPEEYTKLLCETYQAVKAANPDAVVLSGALAPTAEIQDAALNDYLFLQRMYDAGAGQCFDTLSAQGYGLWSGPTDHRMRPFIINYGRNQFLRDIMVRNGDAEKAIWISEMNWNAAPEDVEPRYGRVTLDQQALYAPLAYERAEEDWPWIGVIAFWYFKRADDVWLSERRPEAYFQMSEPDFTLMPVYNSMKQHITSDTPTVHQGTHTADHWAITYPDSWKADGFQRIADEDSEPLTFTFKGTEIALIFGPPGETPNSAISFSVDGRGDIVPTAHTGGITWKGSSGRHTITIVPTGDVTIAYYQVRNDVPVLWLGLAVAVIVINGAIYASTRRLDEGNE
jgi:polysaccharide biosynthesis protein PslG